MDKNNQQKIRDWYLFDAKDQILGRLATQIADLLRGKKKVIFAPNADNGDYVVVVNADKVVLTGRKEEQKRYYRHSGYLGNLKTETVADMKQKRPGEILRQAVLGMLPKNRLQKEFMKRFMVYESSVHPHNNIKFKNID